MDVFNLLGLFYLVLLICDIINYPNHRIPYYFTYNSFVILIIALLTLNNTLIKLSLVFSIIVTFYNLFILDKKFQYNGSFNFLIHYGNLITSIILYKYKFQKDIHNEFQCNILLGIFIVYNIILQFVFNHVHRDSIYTKIQFKSPLFNNSLIGLTLCTITISVILSNCT